MNKLEKKRQREVIRFWRESAARDRATAKSLLRTKHYDWSLFLYHLAIEKLSKALVVQAGVTPPYTHDLERLAVTARLPLSAVQRSWLIEVTKFSIEARYPWDKEALYRRATPSFTRAWHQRCDTLYEWLAKNVE